MDRGQAGAALQLDKVPIILSPSTPLARLYAPAGAAAAAGLHRDDTWPAGAQPVGTAEPGGAATRGERPAGGQARTATQAKEAEPFLTADSRGFSTRWCWATAAAEQWRPCLLKRMTLLAGKRTPRPKVKQRARHLCCSTIPDSGPGCSALVVLPMQEVLTAAQGAARWWYCLCRKLVVLPVQEACLAVNHAS